MFLFLKMAAANVLKHSRSTVTILVVVFICVFAMEFTVGYMDGFKVKLVNDAMQQSGHITVYNKKFYDNLDFAPVEHNVTYTQDKIIRILEIEGVKDIRAEINFGAAANTEADNKETMVKAIDPLLQSGPYKKRRETVTEGRFIEKSEEILIGTKMAKSLKVGVGDKIILLTMDSYGGINAAEGTVSGIFRNFNPVEEERLVICTLQLAQQLLAIEGRVTELIVNVKDYKTADKTAAKINDKLGEGETAVSWQVEMAYMVPMLQMMDVSVWIIMGIIIFVAGMGISNSFLMNIMGRLPEFGVLRAMGMSKPQMFSMIMTESFLLGVIGTVAGLIPGGLLVWYLEKNPINYESMGDVFEDFEGLDSYIGTALTAEGLMLVLITGILISLIASLYPAISAVRKKPVEILRVTQ